MINPVFPTLTTDQDSKYYTVELEDPAIKTQIEGGYVVSRAKHTRPPRRTFTSGFSNMEQIDYATLETFYDSVRGASVIFDWSDPVSHTVRQVRFAGKLGFKYVGIGGFHRWDVTFSVEQA